MIVNAGNTRSQRPRRVFTIQALAFMLLAAAGSSTAKPSPEPLEGAFEQTGRLEAEALDEVSGLQAAGDDTFFVHNDDGPATVYMIDAAGRHLGSATVRGAKNRDWEDITLIPSANGPLLVLGDIGNNQERHDKARLYFIDEPVPGEQSDKPALRHRLELSYPDGPRDAEAMAYDPHSGSILILTKRDKPPRLYGLQLAEALAQDAMEADYLGIVPGFRPPTLLDLLTSPNRGFWVSQPTGMDISVDGRLAAVVTYRSLYLFRRSGEESWAEAFQREPIEYIGPPGLHEEAVAFSPDGRFIYVTTEKRPAPVHRVAVPRN